MKLSEILKEQFLTDHDEIKAWLDEMEIENYVIKPDGIVDVNGNVNLHDKQFASIPVQFGIVTGYFDCSYSKLTSLAGCPSSVGKDFGCIGNKLTSLTGCPSSVGGHFYCTYNKITSLEGIADQLISIKGKFICDEDKIKSHVLGLMLIDGLLEIDCNDQWAEILNECIKNKLGIYDAQTKLYDAYLEEYAQL